MPKIETRFEDILWCLQHHVVNTQCCGGPKEKIGFMEVIESVQEV